MMMMIIMIIMMIIITIITKPYPPGGQRGVVLSPPPPPHTAREGRKEMFYLTTHSTHFILRLYGVGHMVKDHSDSERVNPLPPHGLLFPINSKGSFICTITHT